MFVIFVVIGCIGGVVCIIGILALASRAQRKIVIVKSTIKPGDSPLTSPDDYGFILALHG